jgi:DNA-binding response OmpR family regulator
MKVLIVEDDLALSDVIGFTIRRAGFEVLTAHDGASALETFKVETPDFVILDIKLPKLNGLAVLRQIRAEGQIPVIILSVQGEEKDVVRGLELGADDYMVKPFNPRELVARIQAVIRRTGHTLTSGDLVVANLALDRTRNEVRYKNYPPVRLTPLEARLLESLMLNAGRVLPSEALINTVWGIEGGDRTMLKQVVYRLRAKLDVEASGVELIETVPGVGYGLVETP